MIRRSFLGLLAVTLLSACTALHPKPPLVPSYAFEHPEETSLGLFLFFLLPHPFAELLAKYRIGTLVKTP